MVVLRGQVWWGDLGEPRGSTPGYRRPVLVVQSDVANSSRIPTTLILVISSNLSLRSAPGNVLLASGESGLEKDSVINVSQFVTVNKTDLLDLVGFVPPEVMLQVDLGLKHILSL